MWPVLRPSVRLNHRMVVLDLVWPIAAPGQGAGGGEGHRACEEARGAHFQRGVG